MKLVGGTMVYTASAPVNVDVRKSTSSIEPIAAVAPIASISFCFSALLLITITSCPFLYQLFCQRFADMS